MSIALSIGVSGLQSHQKMLDVAGNNLANLNTTAFKASRITFSELLCNTLKNASQPTANIGGTNPQQTGNGVGIAGIDPIMLQGNIVNTGNPLDVAIEGEGYFVLNDGQQNLYTRAGAFGVDADSYLIDPTTGYRVQRIGEIGVSEGFQTVDVSGIIVPYDAALPASATSSMSVQGNLSPDALLATVQTQVLTAEMAYTVSDSAAALTTLIKDLDQYDDVDGTVDGGTITIVGNDPAGDAYTSDLTLAVDATTTLGDLVDQLNTVLGSDGTASLDEGKISITDAVPGYSKTDFNLSFSAGANDDTLTVPGYFKLSTVGGEEVQNVGVTIFDSQGGAHVLSAAFVRTDTKDLWDLVLTSVTGDIETITMNDRRIEGITFDPGNGSYVGLTGSDTAEFAITFTYDTSTEQTVSVDLGTENKFDGLTQFSTGQSGTSTAVVSDQNGYAAGNLFGISINNEGILIGSFSNGIKKDIAAIQIALFQNAAGLFNVGGGYYTASANSGEAVSTQGMASGAGTIWGSSLEKSNADVATEFINMIQAQNGFQANARTITVANEVLRELTNLIR